MNTTPPTAYADMRGTQERFGKHGGRIAYHWIESFAPGEITAREAMRMGREMIHRYLGDRYEAVYAVHNDHEHIHVHIIWNATSFIDGKKFHAPPGTYLGQIRRESDALCKERGYAVVRRGEKNNGRSYGEWKADRDGQITLRDTIRRDVDAAIRASVTLKGFGQALRSMGYEIKNTPQSISLLAPGAKRFVRLRSLGAHYTQEAILERIAANNSGSIFPPTANRRNAGRPIGAVSRSTSPHGRGCVRCTITTAIFCASRETVSISSRIARSRISCVRIAGSWNGIPSVSS